MLLNLNQIAQIAVPVVDPDRSEAFYRDMLGLRKLYRFGDLCFFDCAGVRLFLDKVRAEPSSSTSLRASGWSSISARTGKRMNDLPSAAWNVRGSASIGRVAVPLGQNPEGHEESPHRQWRRIY
jgi:catechol 2,3-dioxygenase-like lactoylglutathione lyase family enzyme